MAEVQSLTINLENRGLMIMRPGDLLPPGYLPNYLNLTANTAGFIESRRGTVRVSNTNLGAAVHSQGRLIVNGTPYIYQGAGTSLYRAFSSIATGFSGNPLVMREGFPDLAITPQEIMFDSVQRIKDNGTVTTNFGIAGPMQMASAVTGGFSSKTIDTFEYTTDGAIQAAWATAGATVTTTTTTPAVGTYSGNLAVAASTTGTMTKVGAIDLGRFSTAGDSTDADLIALYLRVDVASRISEIRILFDVDSSTNDFTKNFYWKSVIPGSAFEAAVGLSTATAQLSNNLQNPVPYVVDQFGNPTLDDNGNPVIDTSLSPQQLATGANQWLQIFTKKSDFTRVGTSSNTWANVASIRIQVVTNAGGTINLGVDSFFMQSGNNLDATDYEWLYRYKNEVTGSVSPFSPDMTSTVEIVHSNATVTVRNPRDTQVTHIELYRRGGNSSIFAYATEQVVATWSGTVTITDSTPDASLGDTTDLNQVELANLLVTPSAIATSVRKTTDNGSSYTDYTAAVGDDGSGTYANLSFLDTVANGDWLVIGADGPFRQIIIAMDAAVNTNTSAMTVSYWNGSAWRPVFNFTDGTKASGKTLAAGGNLTFDFPADWAMSTINTVAAFYVRISVSAALSIGVHVTEVRLGANAFDPTVCETHAGRVWCDDATHTNRLWYSERFGPEVFLSDNFIGEPTSGDPIVRPYALDDQLFAFTQSTVNRVVGTTPQNFDMIPTGSEVGLFSKYAICKGQGYIYYRAYDGIYKLPASGFSTKLSVPIDPLFNGIAGGTDAHLQPIDPAYASTETMEFFNSKIRFGYRATNGIRYELIYDTQTERWEETDRMPTSYLRLDDLGLVYLGSSDGYVYQLEYGNQDQSTDIAIQFSTAFQDFGVQSQTKQITEIVIDADLAGETLDLFADLDNGVGTSQTVSRSNSARGALQFAMSPDTQARNVALRVNSTNGGSLVKFYKVTFFFIVLPTPRTVQPSDWTDFGYARWKGIRRVWVSASASGSMTMEVQIDEVSRHTETFTVGSITGRKKTEITLPPNLKGVLFRFIFTTSAGARIYLDQSDVEWRPLAEQRGYQRTRIGS